MEQTIELRIVDPKTLTYADKRDPRQVPADRLSDAALKANSNAIGFVQPPLFSEKRREPDDHAGRRRIKIAIANKLTEIEVLVKPADRRPYARGQRECRPRADVRFCVATVLLGSHGCYGFRRYSWGISRKAHRRPGQVFPQRSEDNA